MKTLLLARHAKSSWDNPDWTDFGRPLNTRGMRDAYHLASIMAKKNIKLDIVISSPAIRAITTAQVICEKMGYKFDGVKQDKGIYEIGNKYVTKLIADTDNSVSTMMIFGHNPDITSLVTFYSGQFFENMPTCGIICLKFNTDNWTDTLKENGEIVFFEYPKLYSSKE
jgi:phosphohistidine phosphatase